MKKFRTLTLIIVLGAVVAYMSSVSCGNNTPGNNGAGTAVASAGNQIKTLLSPVLPFDASIGPNDKDIRTSIRRDFDIFSWQSFVALCWPTDTNEVIGQHGDNATVWGTWKKNYEIFLQDGQKPAPWDQGAQSKQQILSQESKVPLDNPDLEAIFQPELTGPLVDQNSQYARFEIAVNKLMFDYIDTHVLYNIQGQQAFTDTISFPMGNLGSTPATSRYGAIMVKASWKILGDGDDTSRFHKVKATIHITALPPRGIKDSTYEAWVGLVGFHIGTRTTICPQWIWSTFEQVDNCPDTGAVQDKHYSFYNYSKGKKGLNKPPVQPWNAGIKDQRPSQVARIIPIDAGTQALNDSFKSLLVAINPKSVWQYYELVGTQWPVNGDSRTDNTGNPFPVYMANCTLETYDQGTVPGVSSSCIGCHNAATSWSGRPSDFTFLLKTAKALKK
jgi:hypothetical protein